MHRFSNLPSYAVSAPPVYLLPALSWLRWLILAAMLLISIIWPLPSRTGHPLWMFLAGFMLYNLVIEALRWSVPRLFSFAWVPLLDLPMASLFYLADSDPTGPMSGLFYLAIISAAICLPAWVTMLYTAAAVVIVLGLAPTLPLWSIGHAWNLSIRVAILSLAGLGTAILAQLLGQEAARADAMRREAETLSEIERLRAQFVASISHDLRTPLTAIRAGLGMLSMSLSDRLRPDERDLLSNTQRNTTRLNLLINDLLAYNQLAAGVLQLDRQRVDLRAVVRDAIATVEPLLQTKGQPLTVHLPDPLPVLGDSQRLGQALVNVLANAYHHTPSGTRIAVTHDMSHLAGHVRLIIQDTGPGVPSDQLEAIFERFRHLSRDGGSGLGLAISRELIELHGGRIWATSQPGDGLAIHIVLPREQEGTLP